ncbi:MAG: hypothetical protein JW725_03835 [Candidatus Babeliaceae bacterium]|nr:hypothetical protein [Candidatus Babeliaceae bacterium]
MKYGGVSVLIIFLFVFATFPSLVSAASEYELEYEIVRQDLQNKNKEVKDLIAGIKKTSELVSKDVIVLKERFADVKKRQGFAAMSKQNKKLIEDALVRTAQFLTDISDGLGSIAKIYEFKKPAIDTSKLGITDTFKSKLIDPQIKSFSEIKNIAEKQFDIWRENNKEAQILKKRLGEKRSDYAGTKEIKAVLVKQLDNVMNMTNKAMRNADSLRGLIEGIYLEASFLASDKCLPSFEGFSKKKRERRGAALKELKEKKKKKETAVKKEKERSGKKFPKGW